MSTPPTCGGAPHWLRELAAARTHYEEMFGWPVVIEVERRVLAAPVGGVLDVVTMPATLGEHVLVDLQLMMLAGPVSTGPDEASWMFFTQPITGPRRDAPAELCDLQVHLVPRGAHIAIPTHLNLNAGLRWITQPQSHRLLPPWSVVIGVTRRVAAKLTNSEPTVRTTPGAAAAHRLLIAS